MSGSSSKSQKKNHKRAANSLAKRGALAGDPSKSSSTPRNTAEEPNRLASAMKGVQVSDFHCRVTKLSAAQVQKANDAFLRKVDPERRPSEDEYKSGTSSTNKGNYTYSKTLLKALTTKYHEYDESSWKNNLEMFFSETALLIDIAVLLAFDGFKTLENLAVADRSSWSRLSSNMAVFNFISGGFEGTPQGKVFLAITPEYTIADFVQECNTPLDSELAKRNSWVQGSNGEHDRENKKLRMIKCIYNSQGRAYPYWANGKTERFLDNKLTESVRSLPPFSQARLEDELSKVQQVKSSSESLPWQFSTAGAVNSMSELVNSIFARRNNIEVLHFQKVPLLDRRLVAIILRGCPRVRMIGIYDCRLIHFGDVICLLDLISEVNTDRRANDLPEIEAFDFFPNFNYGMPWENDHARTYGLTWGPYDDDLVRRGFFRVLLEAHLKASRMGLKILFDERHAFRTYIGRIPAVLKSVPHFLDALFKHMDALRSKRPDTAAQERELDNMLSQINMGLETRAFSPSMPKATRDRIKKALHFCCSCGYEMGEHFFTNETRPSAPHQRRCAGCLLRYKLDIEEDGNKLIRRDIIGILFRDWKGLDFNKDAPMHQHGRSLLNLVSEEAVRPAEPGLQMDANGNIFQPNFQIALVRDGKSHFDSLQSLPDLEHLASRARSVNTWLEVLTEAQADDALRATRLMLHSAYPSTREGIKGFLLAMPNELFRCHPNETQTQRREPPRKEFW